MDDPLASAATGIRSDEAVRRVVENLAAVVRAPTETLELTVLCLIAEGHLIIEDLPGAGTARLAATSVTSAPRSRASSATATPIRPEERLPRKRTASSGSRVPPALTSTLLPAS